MKKAVFVSALALLLLTGCANAEAQPEAAAPPSSSAAGTAAPAATAARAAPAARETEEQACGKLLGADGSGPLYQSIRLVRISDGTFGFQPSTAESTDRLHQTILAAADTAPEDIGTLLTQLSAGSASALQVAGGPGAAAVTFDPFGWSEAAGQLLSRCAPYESAAPNVPSAGDLDSLEAVGARFPGYPLVVEAASVDYRAGAWLGGKLVDGRVVALAPGLYAPYNPDVPDLASYYEGSGAASGDTAMKQTVFPGSGAAGTFTGIRSGTQEP
ncbi:hypothetical protein ITX31_00995 [Arthrobacter gandavensis]|uniref:hypothetical protein n=1 Tax=Arthrobacter gandavensis TaxID=169960 RepID=UPI00188DE734|nr:hypothetical protein [Arthrobacter gandavensis]MBF4992688.1 hypothetical protein [Arthrobacter gandavensis]